MAEDQHAALIRAYIDEVFNGHRLDGVGQYWDDALTSHWLGMETIHGLPAWRAAMEAFFAAFPNAAYTLDDMFFAGGQGVWRGHWQATQQGEWQGIAASGRNVTWTVIIIGRFAGGKLIEDWVELDRLGLFQQLGCIPTGSSVG
ncbi:ester cyclase [Methylobacterium durans]|uniref:ester cyclase n=1 Tax=Methylobacterium durans TaxID=2202825 RepID=UPI002AFE33B6|nr:ester cyclase [Methylobacterium durans]MEA1834312.1 ester cyclase [Methylobacterium durans]